MSEMNMEAVEETAVDIENIHMSAGIAVITSEILFYKQQAGCAIIEIGRLLIKAKEQMKHGEWIPWLRDKVDFSERTAQRFMKCAEEYGGNTKLVTDLGLRKALALLALPESERDEFASEKHEVNGAEKSVGEMTSAELEKAIRERDEARRELQEERQAGEGAALRLSEMEEMLERAGADLNAAEQDKAKMAEDMKFLNERLEGLNDEIVKKEQELSNLRSQPVDVAIEYRTDPKELDLARAEAAQAKEEELKAKIEKAEKALEKAKDAKAKAEEECKSLQSQMEAAQEKAAAVTEDLERVRKEAQLAADKDMAKFMLLFEQGQENANRMHGILQKMDLDGRKETADKLRKALAALAEQIKKAAETAA